MLIRTVTPICFCLIAALVIGAWQSSRFLRQETSDNPVLAAASEKDKPENSGMHQNNGEEVGVQLTSSARPYDDEKQQGMEPIRDEDNGMVEWNGKTITYALLKAIKTADQNNQNDVLEVYPFCSVNRQDMEFVYLGKPLRAYAEEAEQKKEQLDRLGMLLKTGEELKYGEALVTTGIPEGIKWAKELYEKTVAYIGNDLLEKYLVNGEFLSEQVEEDSEKLFDEIKSAEWECEKACNAWQQERFAKAKEQLEQQGVRVELSERNSLRIFVTVDELERLELDDLPKWVFSVRTETEDTGNAVEAIPQDDATIEQYGTTDQ